MDCRFHPTHLLSTEYYSSSTEFYRFHWLQLYLVLDELLDLLDQHGVPFISHPTNQYKHSGFIWRNFCLKYEWFLLGYWAGFLGLYQFHWKYRYKSSWYFIDAYDGSIYQCDWYHLHQSEWQGQVASLPSCFPWSLRSVKEVFLWD